VSLRYDIAREADGTLLATGRTDLACLALDREPRGVRPLPDGIRAVLVDQLADPESGAGPGREAP
jgi:acyl-CoA thioesterase FadM